MRYLRGGRYSYTPSKGHRSGLEDSIARQIKLTEDEEVYERHTISYIIPASTHTYTPDFVLQNGIIIEAKGIFDTADRQKHIRIKQQYPHLDIRFVFSSPSHKIYKGSKTTYADWCKKHGFLYAAKLIPAAWFREPQKDTQGLKEKPKKKERQT